MEPTTSTVSTDPQPMQTRSAKKRKANKPTCECCEEGMVMYELELPAKASKSLLKMMKNKNPSKDPVEIKIPPHLLRKAKYIMHDDDDDLDSAKKSKVDGQNKEKSMSYKEFVKHIEETCAEKGDVHADRDYCMTDFLKGQLITVEHNSNPDCCDCDKREGESDSNSGGSNSGSDESDSGSDSESDSSSGITSNTSSEESDKE